MNINEAEIHGVAAVKDAKLNDKRGRENHYQGPLFEGPPAPSRNQNSFEGKEARSSIKLNIDKIFVSSTG